MASDDVLITRALTWSEGLTTQEREDLMEFLFQVRSGGKLSGQQRAKLHAIAEKVRSA